MKTIYIYAQTNDLKPAQMSDFLFAQIIKKYLKMKNAKYLIEYVSCKIRSPFPHYLDH